MKKRLAITDLTRMQAGRVCVAGYDEGGACIRPVLPPPGVFEDGLYVRGRPIIFPFALVEYELIQPISHPPHTEDCVYDPRWVRLVRRLNEAERRALLDRTLSPDVDHLFGAPIIAGEGFYIPSGQGARSLGTIRPRRICRAAYEASSEGQWKCRLNFIDGHGATYWLTVTDLAWRYYAGHQRSQGKSPAQATAHLMSLLRNREVFLRIGLTRGWAKHPDRCYLQVTAIHTFPDYLGGRTFADFAPASP